MRKNELKVRLDDRELAEFQSYVETTNLPMATYLRWLYKYAKLQGLAPNRQRRNVRSNASLILRECVPSQVRVRASKAS